MLNQFNFKAGNDTFQEAELENVGSGAPKR